MIAMEDLDLKLDWGFKFRFCKDVARFLVALPLLSIKIEKKKKLKCGNQKENDPERNRIQRNQK